MRPFRSRFALSIALFSAISFSAVADDSIISAKYVYDTSGTNPAIDFKAAPRVINLNFSETFKTAPKQSITSTTLYRSGNDRQFNAH